MSINNYFSLDFLESIYEKLLLIRRFEEKIIEIYPTDKIKSPIHLSIGQESPSVGVCAALKASDYVFGTYRSHALYIAKGGRLNNMMAELYGKKDGFSSGKGGSMHLVDGDVGMMGTSAIVATTIPQAAGFAFAQKYNNSSSVTIVFFGDGATEEGVYYETLNFAALNKLPIIFVCENNGYAINSPASKRVATTNYCQKAESFGVGSIKIMNNNVLDLYSAVSKLVNDIRLGYGPFFVEVETYRWLEHVGPQQDWNMGYRARAEVESWIANDELVRIKNMLPLKIVQQVEDRVTLMVLEAVNFAEEGKFPVESDLFSYVYHD